MTISAQTKDQLSAAIEAAWESRATLAPNNAPSDIRDAVAAIIQALDQGELRVAEKKGADWITLNGSRKRYF